MKPAMLGFFVLASTLLAAPIEIDFQWTFTCNGGPCDSEGGQIRHYADVAWLSPLTLNVGLDGQSGGTNDPGEGSGYLDAVFHFTTPGPIRAGRVSGSFVSNIDGSYEYGFGSTAHFNENRYENEFLHFKAIPFDQPFTLGKPFDIHVRIDGFVGAPFGSGGNSTTLTLEFFEPNSDGEFILPVAASQFDPVPEPSTILLSPVPLLALVYLRRRERFKRERRRVPRQAVKVTSRPGR